MAQVKQQNDLVLTINHLTDKNISELQRGKWKVCRIFDHGPVQFGPLFDTRGEMIKFLAKRIKELWPQ